MSMGPELYPLSASSGSGSCRNEQRRVCHINAEQKRRCNIKNGFDTLKSILPSINHNVNLKLSKASMLQKAALYINSLSAEQKQQADEQAMLKQQIENLKQTISAYQCQLPASGGPVGCQGSSQAREMLQDYVRRRTLENWKFWIFSLLIEPLFETYYNSVSTTSLEDSCKTIFTWLDRSCGLVSLRKDVLESLTFLSTSTNILNTPQTLPTEAVDAVKYHAATGTTTTQSSNQTGAFQQGPPPTGASTCRNWN
nr:basic helix-loop-helix transcription factor [Loropetalum chinense var. rubrum]